MSVVLIDDTPCVQCGTVHFLDRPMEQLEYKPMIIGFAGRAKVGKTTAAEYIAENYGYTKYSFAQPIKDLLLPFFGWDERHATGDLKEIIDPNWGFSPREAFQKFGTEFARSLDPGFWIKVAARRTYTSSYTVIDDIRFENEAAWVRENGIVVHISRASAPAVRAHSSETPLTPCCGDWEIPNDEEGVESLYTRIDVMLRGTWP